MKKTVINIMSIGLIGMLLTGCISTTKSNVNVGSSTTTSTPMLSTQNSRTNNGNQTTKSSSSSLQNDIFNKTPVSSYYLPTFVPKGEKVLNIQYNNDVDVLLIYYHNITIFEGTKPNILKVNQKLVAGKTFNISNSTFCQWFHNNTHKAILVKNGQNPLYSLVSSETLEKDTLMKVASSFKLYTKG